MEGACVLAEALSTANSVEDALASYVARCRPRADWVQQQSLAMNRGIAQQSPAVRNAVLRERGIQMMYHNFGPLIPAP